MYDKKCNIWDAYMVLAPQFSSHKLSHFLRARQEFRVGIVEVFGII